MKTPRRTDNLDDYGDDNSVLKDQAYEKLKKAQRDASNPLLNNEVIFNERTGKTSPAKRLTAPPPKIKRPLK